MSSKLLVIDDEPSVRELIAVVVNPLGFEVQGAGSLAEAKPFLTQDGPELFLTALRLPDGDGTVLIHQAGQLEPPRPVAVITASSTSESATKALRIGAFDYLPKPIDTHRLRSLVQYGIQLSHSKDHRNHSDTYLIGNSPAMEAVRKQIRQVARSEAPVLITGESGTGKELAARAIHQASLRSRGPFVPLNCAAIPEQLIESELFGYRKGAFTGASSYKTGLFQEAAGGILFLDEVGDLNLSVQANLLRALQELTVRPLGATQESPVDVWILAATHRDLREEVASGRFREDLFYRLDVLQVTIPPLREHPEDMQEIAQAVLTQRHRRRDDPPMPSLSPSALDHLKALPLLGNVRELENILERALTLTRGTTIPAEAIRSSWDRVSKPPEPPAEEESSFQLDRYLNHTERGLIREALEATGGNKTAAAQRLGISLRSLRYRIQKLGME